MGQAGWTVNTMDALWPVSPGLFKFKTSFRNTLGDQKQISVLEYGLNRS